MNNLILRILRGLWIVLPYEDVAGKHHKFNLVNPIGYVLLIGVALYAAIKAGIQVFGTVVSEAWKAEKIEAKKPVASPVNGTPTGENRQTSRI